MNHGFLDVCDGVLCGAAEDVTGNIDLGISCRFDRLFCNLRNAGALERGDLDDLTAERLGECFDIDDVTVLSDDVHHVDGDDNGDTELEKLCGEVEVSFEVRSVHEVDDGVGAFADQIISRDDLLERVGGEGIDAGEVRDDDPFGFFEFTFFFLYRNAGPVSYELIGAGERIEKRCFTGVGVSGKSNA